MTDMNLFNFRRIVTLAMLIGLVAAIGIWFRNRLKTSTQAPTASPLIETIEQVEFTPEASPEPFEELTIPYLRTRNYESSMTEPVKIAETETYTAYLTSYNSDGLEINALLTEPKGQRPLGGWPGVIFVHGYIPPEEYQTTSQYAAYVDYLASHDLAVFKVDLRGHGTSEGEAGGAYYSSDYVIDVLNARSALAATSFVKKDSIGLWGHSMAGNVVLRSLAAQPEIKAAVIWAGAGYTYTDIQEFAINDNSYQPPASESPQRQRRQQLFDAYGQFDPNSAFWRKVPATNYLSDLTGSNIQVHHATDDLVVAINYSRNLDQLLTQAGVNHQLVEYNSGGHNLTGLNFTDAMEATVSWFKNYLL